MRSTYLLLFACLWIFGEPSAGAQKLTHEELLDVLGIQSWRVPLPKNKNLEWKIEVVDAKPHKAAKINPTQLDPQPKALIVVRKRGGDTFEFTLKQRAGASQGKLELDICTEKEKKQNACESGSDLVWFAEPKPIEDGTKFVLGEIAPMLNPEKPRKQIILETARFRLEDR